MAVTRTLTEVSKHNKPDDAWMVIHNKVYDVTKYLEEHPGGSAILLEVAGVDATAEFENIGHSAEARDELEAMHVGDLPDEEQAAEVEIYRPKFEHVAQVSAVTPLSRRSDTAPRRFLRAATKLTVTAGFGAAAWAARDFDWSTVKKILRDASLSRGQEGGAFWYGVGIATIAEISGTFGLSLWAWSKFDVQAEFTHQASRRPARSDRINPIKKIGLKTAKPSSRLQSRVLDAQQWRHFKLVRSILVSPDVYKFVFALPHPEDQIGLPTGQHIALRANIQGKSVSRSYTPISNNSDLGRIELIVKVYEQGLMSKHLQGMKVGDTIEIRGPKGAMQYTADYARHIGMVAGGTGITPMYQMIRAICEDDSDDTRISLLYASNQEGDILLREELDGFAQQCPDKFSVNYVLSKPPLGWMGSSGFVTADLMKQRLPPAEDDSKILLCGPPPMINAMKKNLAQLGFKEPGLSSKVTDQVFLF